MSSAATLQLAHLRAPLEREAPLPVATSRGHTPEEPTEKPCHRLPPHGEPSEKSCYQLTPPWAAASEHPVTGPLLPATTSPRNSPRTPTKGSPSAAAPSARHNCATWRPSSGQPRARWALFAVSPGYTPGKINLGWCFFPAIPEHSDAARPLHAPL